MTKFYPDQEWYDFCHRLIKELSSLNEGSVRGVPPDERKVVISEENIWISIYSCNMDVSVSIFDPDSEVVGEAKTHRRIKTAHLDSRDAIIKEVVKAYLEASK